MKRSLMYSLPLLTLLLAGCGEYAQSVPYEEGGYQGKTDQRAWDSVEFMKDRWVWKQMTNERAQRQNEFQRTGEGQP